MEHSFEALSEQVLRNKGEVCEYLSRKEMDPDIVEVTDFSQRFARLVYKGAFPHALYALLACKNTPRDVSSRCWASVVYTWHNKW
jgi:hypothetical protein